ncbi:STAS domain-containing protein [Ferrimonas aestuarii]|uniref:Anti-sigma factor antagonist n=1 Tax=Ferrimonas aestuarii TaxID=2569539 RepID=A0A4U1BMS9_9GAMM|nr:STAS domain-containing protein [Ferrimonas aestuarii]TKB53013.1 STAS domain-containing protein [Ferrimonas aestuarii]
MELHTESRKGHLIVTLKQPRLDASSAPSFRSEVETIIEQGHEHIVLDLSEVKFMDSSGLGAVVAVLKSLKGNGKLQIVGLQKAVEELFRLTRMDRIFQCHKDVSTALSA